MAYRQQKPAEGRDNRIPVNLVGLDDIANERCTLSKYVSVVAVVKSVRAPIKTNGRDWKSIWILVDHTSQDEAYDVELSIFRPEREQIPVPIVGDVVSLHSVKIQKWKSAIGLITNFGSSLHVYSGPQLPQPPASGAKALKPSVGLERREPDEVVHKYAAWLRHNVAKSALPDEATAREEFEKSLNVREKFSLLEKVTHETFYDLLVQVVKGPRWYTDRCAVWVTDYTENARFRNFAWGPGQDDGGVAEGPDGDPYNYMSRKSAGKAMDAQKWGWKGPLGKRSMLLTMYEPYATTIRENEVGEGSWIHLKNVRIKIGSKSEYLEGAHNEEKEAWEKEYILVVDPTEKDGPMPGHHERVLDALRRKKQYLKEKDAQIRELQARQASSQQEKPADLKRKAADEFDVLDNSGSDKEETDQPARKQNTKAKRRRQEKRRKALEEQNGNYSTHPPAGEQQRDEKSTARPGSRGSQQTREIALSPTSAATAKRELALQALFSSMNSNIKCENASQPLTPLSAMLVRKKYEVPTPSGPVSLTLPFVNENYHVAARVVDFWPDRLADFAIGRRVSEFDVLESGDESESESEASDGSAEGEPGTLDKYRKGKYTWEWRFRLLLEGVGEDIGKGAARREQSQHPPRVWVEVGNAEAQMLTNMDACNLDSQPKVLAQLEERLFRLWGDLEELKRSRQTQRRERAKERARASRAAAEEAAKRRAHPEMHAPPLASSPVSGGGGGGDLADGPQAGKIDAGRAAEEDDDVVEGELAEAVSNRPFLCCLKQYGVPVRKSRRGKKGGRDGDDDDDDTQWERAFALFGTKINPQ